MQFRINAADDTYATARREDLVQLLDGLSAESRRLEGEIAQLEQTRSSLRSGADTQRVARAEAERHLTELSILAGTAVIVGMAAMNVRAPITPYMMALQEKTIRGTMYGSVRPNIDFPRLVDLYLDGRLKIDQLVSRTYKLEEINEGFTALRTGQVARGVVVF